LTRRLAIIIVQPVRPAIGAEPDTFSHEFPMGLLSDWQRRTWQGCPIYLHPERPDWLVPGPEADQLLQALQGASSLDEAARRFPGRRSLTATRLAMERLHSQLDHAAPPAYHGRGAELQLTSLKECWFHLTNRCNLACRHCLFAASPAAQETMPPALLRQAISEATELGCTLFYFTGGEPLLYPQFPALLREVLAKPSSQAVVLTNGLLLAEQLAAFTQLDRARLHFQLSLDGLAESHEALRGPGTFDRLLASLDLLRLNNFHATISVAVNRANLGELPAMVKLAAEHGVGNLHLLWHFLRGKGNQGQFVPPAAILPVLLAAHAEAAARGITIDNIESLKGQLFSSPGTRYDGSNAGWESLAIGPDGMVYPSPALVGIDALNCGAVSDGLEKSWRQSPVLAAVRRASLTDSADYEANPFKFLIGGGP